jgi:hypothetical protein
VTRSVPSDTQVSSPSTHRNLTYPSKNRLRAVLEEATLAIDELWSAAIRDQRADVLELSEASHAMHRVVIALFQTRQRHDVTP